MTLTLGGQVFAASNGTDALNGTIKTTPGIPPVYDWEVRWGTFLLECAGSEVAEPRSMRTPRVPRTVGHELEPTPVCLNFFKSTGVPQMVVGAQAFEKAADAILSVATAVTEAQGVSQSREHYSQLGKEIFFVGPQIHPDFWGDVQSNRSGSKISNETVAAFLTAAAAKHGPKSVVFISFGSAQDYQASSSAVIC